MNCSLNLILIICFFLFFSFLFFSFLFFSFLFLFLPLGGSFLLDPCAWGYKCVTRCLLCLYNYNCQFVLASFPCILSYQFLNFHWEVIKWNLCPGEGCSGSKTLAVIQKGWLTAHEPMGHSLCYWVSLLAQF